MKKSILIAIFALLAFGCTRVSHNGNLVGRGKVFKIGAGDYGLTYVNGLVGIQAVRENSEMVVETNDGDGFSSPSATTRGICTIRFRTGPQITGYLQEISEGNQNAVNEYIKVMPELNKASWDTKFEKPIDIPMPLQREIAKDSGSPLDLDSLKEKAGGVLDKLKLDTTGISGDGTYDSLWTDSSIERQRAIAAKLATYADAEAKMPGTGETLAATLQHYNERLDKLEAKGKATTRMRIKSATIEDGRLTALMYRMVQPDGNDFDEECPNCVPLED